jgi:hypothetical protein
VKVENNGIGPSGQLLGGGLLGGGPQAAGATFLLGGVGGMNGGYSRRLPEEGGGLQGNQAAMLNGLRFSQGGEGGLSLA